MNTPTKSRSNQGNLNIAGTSGKKIRRVEVQELSIIRNEKEVTKSYAPMVVLTETINRRSESLVRHSHQDRVFETVYKQRECDVKTDRSLDIN